MSPCSWKGRSPVNRRTSALCCLLLAAALLCALPSLLLSLSSRDGERMAERLRPKTAQMLTIWLISDAAESKKHLNEQIALFEKQNAGVRVYLRRADAEELFTDGAVLPDVVLFSPGVVTDPARALLPIDATHLGCASDGLTAGRSAGVQYAVPIWYAPSVLAVPSVFFPTEAIPLPAPKQSSFFDLSTPAPTPAPDVGGVDESASLPSADLIPWGKLLEPSALTSPKGIDLIQLLSMCPSAMRPELIASLASPGSASATSAPTPAPIARVMTLAEYQNAMVSGQSLAGFALTPACTQRVLFLGICKDHVLSRAFLTHLFSPDSQAELTAHSLLSAAETASSAQGDPLTRQLARQYQNGLLFPNAFEHTLQELNALCEDAFGRNQDPVETLLRLR